MASRGEPHDLCGGLPSATSAGLIDGSLIVGVSWGNDSVALVQFLHEEGLTDVTCLYNDTGWSMPAHGNHEAWIDRVTRMEAWAQSIGFKTDRTASVGMEALVHDRKAWPRQGIQFCTWELKMGPTMAWLAEHDPDKVAICVNGKRKAESHIRAETVEWIEESGAHDGRRLWQPLYAHDEAARNTLIERAGFDVLPFKSKECMLCVNTNRDGLREAPEVAIAWVERVEGDLGVSGNGKPRTMFRPARKMGATGIREVVEWAKAPPRKYRRDQLDLLNLLDDGTGPSTEPVPEVCIEPHLFVREAIAAWNRRSQTASDLAGEVERRTAALERIATGDWMGVHRFAEDSDGDFLLRVIAEMRSAARAALKSKEG